MRRILGLLLVMLSWAASAGATTYYVSPTGTAMNPGTAIAPWSLRYALAGAGGTLVGDDVVNILAGVYTGHFTGTVSGTSGHPVIFQAYPPRAPVIFDGNTQAVLTSGVVSGNSGDTVTVAVSDVTDFHVGTVIAFAGLLQQLTITGISSLNVTGTRNCSNNGMTSGGTCGTVPSGARVWSILTPILTTDPSASDERFIGLEVTDTGTDSRLWTTSSDVDFSNQSARRQDGIFTYAARTQIWDCVIHDTFNGLGAWEQAVNGDYVGNVLYNNGFYAPDRGHGHGAYVQNNTGTKTLTQNISFNNFGYAEQTYGGVAAHLTNITWNQLIAFGDATGISPPYNLGTLWGGDPAMTGLVISNSHIYKTPAQVGYGGNNTGITISGNIIRTRLILTLSTMVSLTGNTFAGTGANDSTFVAVGNGNAFMVSDYAFSGNTYYRTNANSPFQQYFLSPDPAGDGCGYYWYNAAQAGYGYCGAANHSWQALGYDVSGSSYTATGPTGTQIVSLTDPHNSARHTAVIYNWGLASTVSLNVSGYGLATGQTYRWRNVADYTNDYHVFVYDGSGSLTMPMTGHTVAKPYGYSTALGANTFPEFGVFVFDPVLASSTQVVGVAKIRGKARIR